MQNLKLIVAIATTMTVFFSSCTSDTGGPENGPGGSIDNKNTIVQFKIRQTGPSTYSAGTNTEPPVAGESEITNVEIYVFNEAGYFESHVSSTVTPSGADFLTDPFTITAGTKFFYILANVPATITLPAEADLTSVYHRTSFETTIQTLAAADISVSGDFFIGTRWGVSTTVAGTGIPGTPEQISQTVGRMAAKVGIELADVISTSLPGTFSNQESRLINVPTRMFLIGQWTGTPLTAGAQVTTPHFTTYDLATDFNPNTGTWQALSTTSFDTPAYTIENTNEVPRNETATSVQVRMNYTPGVNEILQADGTAGGTLDPSGTFWIGEYADGRRFIYAAAPTDPNVVNSLEFTNGLCHFIIPVADESESEPSVKYSVIRNHSYRVTIIAINTLGNNTEAIPNPTDPIEVPADVVVTITVSDWSLIEQNVGL